MTSLLFRIQSIVALILLLQPLAANARESFICPIAPQPVITLDYDSRYVDQDAIRDTLDPKLKALAEAALEPLDAFISELASASESVYTGSLKDREKVANCIANRLATWAQANALSDLASETAKLTFGPRLSALSLILWQIGPFVTNQTDHDQVLAWLENLLSEQIEFWETAPSGAKSGNLRAWVGLAAAAVSTLNDENGTRDWALSSLQAVLCTANPDGSIPQEMTRGKYALHYQLYAIAPLVTSIALLERQGISASGICDQAIRRIVHFAERDLIDGRQSGLITGVQQSFFDGTSDLMDFQLAWIEAYLTFGSSENLLAIARDRRDLFFSKLGGNQTLIWGMP